MAPIRSGSAAAGAARSTARILACARARSTKLVRAAGTFRRALAASLLGLALLASLPPALADYDRYRPYAQQGYEDGRRNSRSERQERRQAERERSQRESLTADERRELNRDLQRANREIYRKGRER